MQQWLFLFSPLRLKKDRKSKNAPVTATAPKPAESKTKKISDLVKGHEKLDGLFPIYRDTTSGTIQMIISEDQIGKEFIHFNQIANGVVDAGAFRGSYRGSKIFKIVKFYNKIEFVEQNTSFYFNPESELSKSADANISESVISSVKIEAEDKEKGLYLIKADELFLKETFSPVKPPAFPGSSPMAFRLGNLDGNKSKITDIRNYPKNTDMVVDYVYSNPSVLNGGSEAVTDGRNVTIKVFHNLMEVPNNDYTPRFDDPRVGYFTTNVTDMTTADAAPYRDLVHRWHLKKKDPNSAISEPVEPIVWWIENSTPMEFRETITEAVLQWNIAFEKAGFKNAMQVKVQPDDATWDAGDVRYNVLRWTSSPQPPFGGYGPSFVNPRTGQILGADIMLEYVYHTNRVKLDKLFNSHPKEESVETTHSHEPFYCSFGEVMQENMLFGQAVLKAMNASDDEMEGMKKEAMLELLMHEVGHTLGLNHNMKASQLYSPAQLDDADFMKGKALTASVMDYTAINVANPGKKQGNYYTVTVGPYDIWAIQFGYTPFASEKQMQDLLALSTKPEHIFGNDADDMRSPGKAIDPRVNTGDMSNDQILYSINRMKLINGMYADLLEKSKKPGKSYQEFSQSFNTLIGQYVGAANIVTRFIGGVYVDRAMVGQVGATQPYTPVSYADQKRAMNTLSTYLFSKDAFNLPSNLYNHLALQRRGFNFFSGPEDPKIHSRVLMYQKNALNHLLHYNTLQRISDSELYGNKYKLAEFMSDLNKAIFAADSQGSVNNFRQNLQMEYTNMLIDMLNGQGKGRYSHLAKSMALQNLKSIRSIAANGAGDTATKAHKTHLVTRIDNALKDVK